MEKTQKLVLTDTRKIEKIHFKYPDLTGPDTENKIKEYYQKLLELKDLLHEYRTKVVELEKEVSRKDQEFREITSNCTIEFATYEKDYRTVTSNLFIAGQGNDILGSYGN